ncbi:hypothetical protein ACLB2K_072654 [Fragaria x ananassa]
MLERIRMDVMVRNANRRVACEKWKDVVGPRIKKMLDKVGQRATQYRAHRGAYTPVVNTITGEDDWEPIDYPIAPPLFNKLPGRPKKKRIPSLGENGNPAPPTPTEGKMPKTSITMTCKLCGQQGHNKAGCPITKAKKTAEAGERTSSGGASTKKRAKEKVQQAPAPPKESRPIKDQVIKSKKG